VSGVVRLEGLMDLYSQGCERSYTVNSSILRAIEPHLKDFQQLLLNPPMVPTHTHMQLNSICIWMSSQGFCIFFFLIF